MRPLTHTRAWHDFWSANEQSVVIHLATSVFLVSSCRFPCPVSCAGAYGSPLYKSYVAVAFGYEPPDDPFYANMFPAGPSGYLPFPTTMAVTDMIGRPLAGKSAMTRVRNAATGAVLPAVKMQEFPHAAASVSVLSRADDAHAAVDEGALEYSHLTRAVSVRWTSRASR